MVSHEHQPLDDYLSLPVLRYTLQNNSLIRRLSYDSRNNIMKLLRCSVYSCTSKIIQVTITIYNSAD